MVKLFIIFCLCISLLSCGGHSVTDTSTLTLEIDGNNNGIFDEQTDFYLFENPNDKEAIIKITYKDKYGKAIFGSSITLTADNKEVMFPMGNTVTTNSSGQATVFIKVEPSTLRNVTTTISVVASATDTKNAILLYLLPVTVSPTLSAISATPDIVNTGGTSAITVLLKTNMNTLVPNGTLVNFQANCGTITPSATTTSGVATATYTAPLVVPADGFCEVTVSSNNVLIGNLKLTIGVIDPTQSFLKATPDTIVLEESSVITALVKNNMGLLVPNGTVVSFAATCGTIPPSSITTNGIATVIFKAPITLPASGKCSISASSSSVSIGTVEVAIKSKLTVTPATQNISKTAGGTATFTITGGIPPYNVTSNNQVFKPNPTNIDKEGGSFSVTVPANSSEATVTFTISDFNGRTQTAVLQIK
ncbi:MAG: hypothetical protein N3A59_04300 [Thermodesulfovibrionales bacterium]|nr:hypothetical protein [Thermodesulfovibrionales bacterium]